MRLEEYGRMHAVEDRQWWYVGMRAITEALLARHATGTFGRVLDAGCGTGRNLQALAGRGRALGIDLSPEALVFARGRGTEVVRGDLLRLPFRERSFALVTSFDVLYHRWVEDDRMAVRELVRTLEPGGLLFVRVPALKLLWGAHDEAVLSRHRYTRPEVESLLRDCGLELLQASYANALLFPLLLVRRTLDRLLGRHGSDVELLAAPLERLFAGCLRAEAFWLRRGGRFPIGASVVALARRPA